MDFILAKDVNEANYTLFLDFSNTRLKVLENEPLFGF